MNHLENANRIVIKIGSSLLTNPVDGLRSHWLDHLAADVAGLLREGTEVVVVSSGAIALGRHIGGFPKDRNLSLEQSQAAAAIGQIKLARAYEEALGAFDIRCAQILLTLDDSENRRRYLNSRATLETLLGLGIVPICNENDTVATNEIRFGDNDRLAAQVAVMINADVLVLLSDVDGLYDRDPRLHANASRIPHVPRITRDIMAMAGKTASPISSGGMRTKLDAARTSTNAGCAMVIANGHPDRPISRLADGDPSTWFEPVGDPQTARKHWIAAMKPRGKLFIDQGAGKALKGGKSLLPAGVSRVTGSFGRGDAVEIIGLDGMKLGHGLVRYTSDECQVIKGKRSGEIAKLLGGPARAALVHRDDMSR